MVKLKKFLKSYRQAGAFHSLLAPHRFIDEHVFLTKSNQLGVLFGAGGIDYECLTEETLETYTHRAAAAWRSFEERFRTYQYVVKQERAQIEQGEYSNPVVNGTIRERNSYLQSKPDGLYTLRLFYAVLLQPSLSQSASYAARSRTGRCCGYLLTSSNATAKSFGHRPSVSSARLAIC